MKINFKNLRVFTDLNKSNSVLVDVHKELAEGLYKTAQGISGHALSLKLYNTKGEEEYSDEEFSIIMNYANNYGTPFFIDSLTLILKEWQNEK